MDIADLLDIEAQLERDRELPEAERDAKTAAIAQTLRGQAAWPYADRGALFAAWARAAAPADGPTTGQTIWGAMRGARVALVVAALAAGWGLARVLLRFEDGHPINVLSWLIWAVAIPFALSVVSLAVGLLLAGAPRLAGRLPTLNLALSALRGAARIALSLVARAAPADPGARARRLATLWHRVRARESLYRQVEVRWVYASAQHFALAAQAGLVLGFATLVVTTDLPFRWSTTLAIDSQTLHGVLTGLAAPWAFTDAALPSAELVEATRYTRLGAAYVQADPAGVDRIGVGAWWTFLFAATVVWGLLPRVLLAAFAGARLCRALRSLPFATREFDELYLRLTREAVRFEPDAPEGPLPAQGPGALGVPPEDPSRAAVFVRWQGATPSDAAVAARLRDRLGWALGPPFAAGGQDFASEDASLAALRGAEALVVVADGWDAPGQALADYLDAARGALGAAAPVVVALSPSDEAAAEREVWETWLAQRGDAYLSVMGLA